MQKQKQNHKLKQKQKKAEMAAAGARMQRALAEMSDAPPAIDLLTVGGIGLACALEYMDFRKQYDWRPEFPTLVAWLEKFNATRPAFADSRPSD